MSKPILAIDYTPAVRQAAGIGRIVRCQVQALIAAEDEFDVRLFVIGAITKEERAQIPRTSSGRQVAATTLSERNMVRLWHRIDSPLPPVDWYLGARPDLLHATDFVLPPTRARRKLLTVHDLAFVRYPDAAMPGLQRYLNIVVPRSVRRADLVIADSASTAHDLHELWNVGEERICVVQGAVEHEQFRPVRDADALAAVRTRYAIGDAPYVLTISRLEPRKNHLRLVEAFAQAVAEAKLPHQLVIGGGKGWLYEAVYARVQELGIAERVKFIGFVDDADLPALYSGAEFFAYPSLYEGFGLPILEALACGVPVLAGDNSCLPEAGGPGALYVNSLDVDEIAERIATLATNDSQRKRLAAAGQDHARQFTWARSAQQLMSAYHRASA